MQGQSQSEKEGDNIHVLLRIRPRNSREIKENAGIIATKSSDDNKQVLVKQQQNDLTKTFTFDRVFGPNDDQLSVFKAIQPMISEVFLGYNCTIFAYGQTGAGKTYTMEGDLSSPNDESGIIPRTLYSLFEQLERDVAEYSVRASYLELYNEELKDLLSPDNNVDSSSRKLKMFEDLNRKGSVMIQGVEEILVKNAGDVISILQRGSMKRQTASTKMNDTSSRSHGIFTITVHIKEATSDGEELLKVGKLHLVDLAGSENIGRSGAEKGRAKEAGMINQSLLTLGRVINALVERSPHIPYRESKLTRILQDSLGGRTKTCIIANISPAKDSLEETLSTLDYAHRAKNIRNKPEVNQKLTKRALIRDYVTQIERLKSDLVATREKNGIFLSPDSYNSLVSENQGNKTQLDEITKTMEHKRDELKAIQATFLEQTDLLKATSTKLDESMEELEIKRSELEEFMAKTVELQTRLKEQTYITNAHVQTEIQLNSVASGLVQTLSASVNDIEGLHQKIERKKAIERENMIVFEEFQGQLFAQFTSMASHIAKYQDSCAEVASQLKEQEKIIFATSDALAKSRNELFLMSQTHTQDFKSYLMDNASTLGDSLNGIVEMAEKHNVTILQEIEKSMAAQKKLGSENIKQFQDLISLKSKKILADSSNLMTVFKQFQQQFSSYLESSQSRQDAIHKANVEEMTRELEFLRAENGSLRSRFEDDRQVLASAQTSFLAEMESKLKDFSALVTSRSVETFDASSKAFERHSTTLVNMLGSEKKAFAQTCASIEKEQFQVNQTSANYLSAHDLSIKDISNFSNDSTQALSALEHHYNISQESLDHSLKSSFKNIDKSVREEMMSVKSASNAGQSVSIEKLDSYNRTIGELNHLAGESQSLLDNHVGCSSILIASLESGWEAHSQDLGNSLEQCHSALQGNDLHQDISTGKTPRKKTIQVTDTWKLTKPHDALIQEYRENSSYELQEQGQNENKPDYQEAPSTPSAASKLPFNSKIARGITKRSALQDSNF